MRQHPRRKKASNPMVAAVAATLAIFGCARLALQEIPAPDCRFGVVAAFSLMFCNHVIVRLPFSSDFVGPDAATMFFAVGTILAFAGFGFFTAVGGRKGLVNLSGSVTVSGSTRR